MPKNPNLPPELTDMIIKSSDTSTKIKFSQTSRFFKRLVDKGKLIGPLTENDLKFLSNSANFNGRQLSQSESTWLKNTNESFEDWFARLEQMEKTSYLVFTKSKKIETLDDIQYGYNVFKTKAEAEQGSLALSTVGRQFFVKINLPSLIVKKCQADGDHLRIAKHVLEINDEPVSFEENNNKFHSMGTGFRNI